MLFIDNKKEEYDLIILEKFNSGELENLGMKRLFEIFEAKTQFEKDAIRKTIEELENDGEIVYKNGRYPLPQPRKKL